MFCVVVRTLASRSEAYSPTILRSVGPALEDWFSLANIIAVAWVPHGPLGKHHSGRHVVPDVPQRSKVIVQAQSQSRSSVE